MQHDNEEEWREWTALSDTSLTRRGLESLATSATTIFGTLCIAVMAFTRSVGTPVWVSETAQAWFYSLSTAMRQLIKIRCRGLCRFKEFLYPTDYVDGVTGGPIGSESISLGSLCGCILFSGNLA